jgi:hypothetical protein
MRYLHPVSYQEKFVASGTYVTTVVGETSPVEMTEEWSIHTQPGDSRFIRIDRAATPTSEHLLAEILQSPDGIIERVDLVWFRQTVSRRVSLTAFDTYVQVGHKTEPDEREYLELDIAAGTRLLPPFILFMLGSVNTPEMNADGQWLTVDAATPVNPPPLRVESMRSTLGKMQTLPIGRRQIDTQMIDVQLGDVTLKVWRDQRLHIPVRVEERNGNQLIRTSELRSVAF